MFFFFKQKTAYELRISDWSSDVCSSDLDFITVDMDPHNTAAAGAMFKKLGVGFQAVNDKGEDFLRAYADDMDFVFLDAYDFDHGKHSEMRQRRYKDRKSTRLNSSHYSAYRMTSSG